MLLNKEPYFLESTVMNNSRYKQNEQLSFPFDRNREISKHATSPVLMIRRVNELRPHPRYEDLCGPIHKKTLFDMAQQGEDLFEEPLVITETGIILDGYKRWSLAADQGRLDLICYQCSVAEDGMALRLLVSLQLRKSVVRSAFFRILLALELEPMFREEARERQRVGGKKKLW